ncbi:hypothetical protein J6590_050363 [Homalodisca vitripennis]|nr:hypothetical protein J6590_050363 [Homalodisca vitripennis]
MPINTNKALCLSGLWFLKNFRISSALSGSLAWIFTVYLVLGLLKTKVQFPEAKDPSDTSGFFVNLT